MLHAIVHPADIQDATAAPAAATLFGSIPSEEALPTAAIRDRLQKALAKILPHLTTEIVKRSDHAKGFVVLPRRWSSSAPLLGSTAAEGSSKIGRTSTARRSRSYASPQSASAQNFVIPLKFPDLEANADCTLDFIAASFVRSANSRR